MHKLDESFCLLAFAGDFYGKTRSIQLIHYHIKIIFIIILIEIRQINVYLIGNLFYNINSTKISNQLFYLLRMSGYSFLRFLREFTFFTKMRVYGCLGWYFTCPVGDWCRFCRVCSGVCACSSAASGVPWHSNRRRRTRRRSASPPSRTRRIDDVRRRSSSRENCCIFFYSFLPCNTASYRFLNLTHFFFFRYFFHRDFKNKRRG